MVRTGPLVSARLRGWVPVNRSSPEVLLTKMSRPRAELAQAGGQRLPSYLKSQRDCVLEPGKLEARRAALEEELRVSCQPKIHGYKIMKVIRTDGY
jgi:hypothetical protein